MIEILNEQIVGSVKSSTGDIHILCEVRLSRQGIIQSIIGGGIYYLEKDNEDKKFIGSFAVNYDPEAKNNRAISLNLNDSSLFTKVTEAINNMIEEIEERYK